MLPFIATLLAKPVLSKLPKADAAKDKIGAVNAFLGKESDVAWLGLARPQATLRFRDQHRSVSSCVTRGEVLGKDKDTKIDWVQFDWHDDAAIGRCILHRARWRFYANNLVSLEISVSKEESGVDATDLVGHSIELRDGAGFLIGIWSAAFVVHKRASRMSFQASTVDDYPLLNLHFGGIVSEQEGICFLI